MKHLLLLSLAVLISAASCADIGARKNPYPIGTPVVTGDSEDPIIRAAEALVDLNDTRAIELLIQALKNKDPQVRLSAVLALGHFNDTRVLRPLFQALNDENQEVYNHAGYALYDMLKDEDASERAIQALDRALEKEPDAYDIWYDKGYVLYYQKKYDEAIQALDKAIEMNPEFTDSWYLKSAALKEAGRIEESDAAYAKAEELSAQA